MKMFSLKLIANNDILDIIKVLHKQMFAQPMHVRICIYPRENRLGIWKKTCYLGLLGH